MVDLKLETVPIVYCCFALHNICEMRNCDVDEQFNVINTMKKKNEIAQTLFILTLVQKDRK